MEITKEILESILDAYSYEIVFVDRQHIVRYMNKTAKERYGERVKINQSLFNCHSENSKAKIEEFLKRADAGEDDAQNQSVHSAADLHVDDGDHDRAQLGRQPGHDAQLQQDGVQVAVRVAAEDDREDVVGIARNGRRVEDDDGNRAHPARQFVDEPREAERHDVAHRSCNHRQQERVFHGGQENIILQNQGDVVVHPDEARGLQNVVVGEGVVDGDEHREDVEGQKQQGVGRQKRIAELHVLRSVPRDARIALSQCKVLFPERGHDECFLLSLRASLRRSADRTPSASY